MCDSSQLRYLQGQTQRPEVAWACGGGGWGWGAWGECEVVVWWGQGPVLQDEKSSGEGLRNMGMGLGSPNCTRQNRYDDKWLCFVYFNYSYKN